MMKMMMKKSIIRMSVIAWVLMCTLTLFPAAETCAQKSGGTIRDPRTSEPRPLDPQHQYNERNSNIICQHIYENLVTFDKNMNMVSELATSWKMAADGKSCTFVLRKGVKFHDGAPFDARAVEANFNRFLTENINSGLLVKNWFKSVDVIDDYTVRINLTRVYTPFLTEMAQIYTRMISPAALKKYGMDVGQNPSGTGPWKFVEWIPGDRITVTRNNDYWKGKPYVENVVFKFVTDPMSRLMGFEANSFDVIDQPQYTDIDRLEKSKKYISHSTVSGDLFHLMFNCAAEPFDQKRVRQAIAYGINKDLIVKSLLGESVVTSYSFGPVFLKETMVKKDAYPYNPARAKEILASLGWKPGPDGILLKDGKRFEFKLVTPFGRYPMDKQIAEAVQANLKQVGLDVKVDVVESAGFLKWLRAPRDEMKASGIGMICRTRPMGASLDFAYVQHYHTTYIPPTGSNSAHYSNKELDELLTGATSVADDKKRNDMYRRAQEILFDELPVIPFYYYRSFMFSYPYVKNIDLFPPALNVAPFISHQTWIDK